MCGVWPCTCGLLSDDGGLCSEKKKVQEVPETLLKKRKLTRERQAKRAQAAVLVKKVRAAWRLVWPEGGGRPVIASSQYCLDASVGQIVF